MCRVGDEMKVKVIAVDEQDRVKLSRKAAMREMAPGRERQPAQRRKSARLDASKSADARPAVCSRHRGRYGPAYCRCHGDIAD